MAQTIEPEGDPTFLAFERARQYGESTLAPRAGRDQAFLANDAQLAGIGLAQSQSNQIEDSHKSLRSRGFGSAVSGQRAAAETRIRSDIALRTQELLSGYTQDSNRITDAMLDELARLGMTSQEEQNEARRRMTLAHAESGVGI